MFTYTIEKDETGNWVVTIGDEIEFEGSEIEAFDYLANHLSACVTIMRRERADAAYAKIVESR